MEITLKIKDEDADYFLSSLPKLGFIVERSNYDLKLEKQKHAKFLLPFPPSVNGLYGGGSGQQRYKTKRYKEWCKSVSGLLAISIDYPVHIKYTFTWPDARSRDGQNYLKAPADLLVNAGVLKDDNYNIIQSEDWVHTGVDKYNSGVLIEIFKV